MADTNDTAEEVLDEVAPDPVEEDTEEQDSTEEEVEETPDEKEDEQDSDDEDDEDKEEEEEPDPDVTVSSSPIRDATKKYPKLFKEFPEFREAYFRDRDFRQIFPSVEDARVAADATEQYQFIQNEVASGNPQSIVDFLAKDTKTLARFGRSFLKGTMGANQEAFEHITKPILIGVLSNAAREAELHGNKNLGASVKWLSQFIFQSPELPTDGFRDEPAPTNGSDSRILQQQLGEFTNEAFEQGQYQSLQMIADSVAGLNLNKAVKKTLIREIFKTADEKITQDVPHMKMMNSLWNKVRKGAITRQNRATIINAYVGAVKKLLPSVRASVLKDNGITVKAKKKEAIRTTDKETRGEKTLAAKSPSARDKYQGKTDEQILDMFLK
jgi:hypothetical protein